LFGQANLYKFRRIFFGGVSMLCQDFLWLHLCPTETSVRFPQLCPFKDENSWELITLNFILVFSDFFLIGFSRIFLYLQERTHYRVLANR